LAYFKNIKEIKTKGLLFGRKELFAFGKPREKNRLIPFIGHYVFISDQNPIIANELQQLLSTCPYILNFVRRIISVPGGELFT